MSGFVFCLSPVVFSRKMTIGADKLKVWCCMVKPSQLVTTHNFKEYVNIIIELIIQCVVNYIGSSFLFLFEPNQIYVSIGNVMLSNTH